MQLLLKTPMMVCWGQSPSPHCACMSERAARCSGAGSRVAWPDATSASVAHAVLTTWEMASEVPLVVSWTYLFSWHER